MNERKVLIVDDSETIRQQVASALERAGFGVADRFILGSASPCGGTADAVSSLSSSAFAPVSVLACGEFAPP